MVSKILLISLCLVWSTNIEINCSGYQIKIPVERKYKYCFNNYTEGTFHDYVFDDQSTITIHCGSNVKIPFNGKPDFGDTLFLNGSNLIRYEGQKDNRFFIEDYYIKSQVTVIAEYPDKGSHVVDLINSVEIVKQ